MNSIQNYGMTNYQIKFAANPKLKINSHIIKDSLKYVAVPAATVLTYFGIKPSKEKELEQKQNRLHELFTMLYHPLYKSDFLPTSKALFEKEYEPLYGEVKDIVESKVNKTMANLQQEDLPDDFKDRLSHHIMDRILFGNDRINDDVIQESITDVKEAYKEEYERALYYLNETIDKTLALNSCPSDLYPNLKNELLEVLKPNVLINDETKVIEIIENKIAEVKKEDDKFENEQAKIFSQINFDQIKCNCNNLGGGNEGIIDCIGGLLEQLIRIASEEEQKAKEYYNGILNYIPADSISAFNPFSEYRNGILEKEAYKENPWYTMII